MINESKRKWNENSANSMIQRCPHAIASPNVHHLQITTSPHREALADFTATIHLVEDDGQKMPTVRSSCFLRRVTNVFCSDGNSFGAGHGNNPAAGGPPRGGSSQRGSRGGVSEKRTPFVNQWSIFSVELVVTEAVSLAIVAAVVVVLAVVLDFIRIIEVEVATLIRAIEVTSTTITIEKVIVDLHRM